MDNLKILDIYGVTYSVNSLGKETYRTYFGLVCTILTGILVTVGFFLLGRDFLYKKNPNVTQSFFLPEESEPVYVNSTNFTIAWRVEDTNEKVLSEDQRYVWPRIQYVRYEKNEDKEFVQTKQIKVNSKKCSETASVKNKDFTLQNLETLQCVDLEELKQLLGSETDVPLYGDWDEKYVSSIVFMFTNCKYDIEKDDYFDCLSFDEIERRNGLFDQYVSFYLPRVAFRPDSVYEPLTINYESLYYRLSPYSAFYEINRYAVVKIDDDIGWIFEEIRQLRAVEKQSVTPAFNFLARTAYKTPGAAKPYMLDIMFGRKQIKVTRSYMKIQTVAANIGGIMQFINVTFMLLCRSVANWHMNVKLVNRFFEGCEVSLVDSPIKKARDEISTHSIRQRSSQFVKKKPLGTGYCKYLINKYCCFKKKSDFHIAMMKMQEVLDVVEIYKIHLKVENLIRLLLDEEAKLELQGNLKQVVQNGCIFFKEKLEEKSNTVVEYKFRSNAYD